MYLRKLIPPTPLHVMILVVCMSFIVITLEVESSIETLGLKWTAFGGLKWTEPSIRQFPFLLDAVQIEKEMWLGGRRGLVLRERRLKEMKIEEQEPRTPNETNVKSDVLSVNVYEEDQCQCLFEF